MKYTVIVNDNFHATDEGDGEGEFDNAEGAIAWAKGIVDKSLMSVPRQIIQQQLAGIALTAEELAGISEPSARRRMLPPTRYFSRLEIRRAAI